MPAAPLPPVLEEKLADLTAEVRRLLVLRGCGWVAVTVLGSAAAAMWLDALLDLPAAVRGLLLLGWLTASAAAAWWWVARPARDPLPPSRLAALVERYFPGLAERLTTLVELRESAGPGNGSRALMAVLAKETDQRTRRLDFSRVAPTGSAAAAGVLAVAAAVMLLGPLPFVHGSGERARRFLLPWYTPAVDVPYRIVVSSGDPVVKRGEPVTLSAYLEPTKPDAALPESATLLVREPGSRAERPLPMVAGEGAAFHLTRPGVSADFEYCVQAGPARSEWHPVAVADPVTLADGSTLTAYPPRYAEGVVPAQTRDGFAEFEVLQHGRVEAALKFTRPPAEASLEWRPADPAAERGAVPIRLEGDRLSAAAEFTVPGDGTLVLVLVGDRGVRTELPAAVRAVPDSPPRFEKVTGLTSSVRDARPDDRIPIELAAQDDVRLDALVVEYCINGNEADVRSEPVRLPGIGSRRVEGAFAFALAGKAKEGEAVHFRVRATDNRSVPELRLGPQSAVFPAVGWAVLRVTSAARPLFEQEILAQRDKIHDRLDAAEKLVAEAGQKVREVRDDPPADGPLAQDQAVRLRDAREKAAAAARLLEDLAGETGLTPELRPLAEAIREVADNPLRAAGAAIKSAENELKRDPRDKAIATADEKLSEALTKLKGLHDENTRVAQARLDRQTLQQIADEQRALAEQAAKGEQPPDELAKKQRDLTARLNDAVNRSELLKGARDAAAEQELKDLLDRARRLAEEQAALNRAAERTDEQARQRGAADLARRQKELADQAARLSERTDTASRLAGATPIDRRPFDQAVERLSRGNPSEALSEQEKAARELDRLAEALARSAAARGDKREAARQIARWEDDLRRRVADAAKRSPKGRLSDEDARRFAEEQRAIRDATDLLRQPNAEPSLARAEDSARSAVRDAADALARKPADAPGALKRAAEALDRLAGELPSTEERTRRAKAQLEQLRKEQDAITRDAAEALRDAAKDALGRKLDAAAAKQDALAKKLRQLDAPGHEARRDAAAAAAERAAADLRAGLGQDVPASQAEARRQLDRLRQALDGTPPADEQADAAARLQRDAADAADRLPARPSAEELERLERLQREVTRKLAGLTAPEAAGQLAEAKDAARAAEEAARQGDRPDELKKKTKEAAQAVGKLADRLAGRESDRDRAERLAREQAAQADKARKAERQPANPDATDRAQRQLQRELDDLEQTRVGKAQEAKRKAAEALQRARQGDPARAAARQQDAADALRKLADEMARNGDRDAPAAQAGPPKPSDADELRRLTGNGNLPSEADAEAARELARQQRALRDASSEAAAELARGAKAGQADALAPLAEEQDKLAKKMTELGKKLPADAPEAGKEQVGQAATSAGRAAEQLRAGSAEGGAQAGTEAERKLADFAGKSDSPTAREARELAGKQAELNERLKKLAGDPAAAAARQQKRQGELTAEADRLAEALRDAAEGRPGSPLGKAAEEAKQAKDRMAQAERDAAAGRAQDAANARRQAGSMLEQAAADAEAAARGAPEAPADKEARDTGGAVRQAGEQMRRAESQLGKPNGAGQAAGSMKQAADALGKAAGGMSRGGQPNGSGAQQPATSGTFSNQPPGAEKAPADITQYLTRPWGELPGDVRSKVIQELAARYGEDYARSIKLYFEALAGRK